MLRIDEFTDMKTWNDTELHCIWQKHGVKLPFSLFFYKIYPFKITEILTPYKLKGKYGIILVIIQRCRHFLPF